jgi:predicted permease
LKKGVTFATAQGEVDAVAADLRRRFPINRTAGQYFRVEPMHEDLVRDARPILIAIMGAVTFLFLIACANVANLLLVRASTRERELAVCAALGGTRWDLIRQMLTESVLLAAAGALLGVAIALLGIKMLIAIGPGDLPRMDSISINVSVLGFTIGSSLLAAVVFGVFPALRASRPNLIDTLRASGRMSGLAAATVLRKGVVIAEVALSFVLLVGSGLMVRSLIALERTDPGFDAHNVLTFVVSNGRGEPGQLAVLMRQLREQFLAVPGVLAVTASSSLPLDGTASPVRWGTEAAAGDPGRFQAANFQVVLPGYFAALKTRLIAGRAYTEDDNRPDRGFIIVDDLLARKAFPHESAIGKRILVRFRTPEAEWLQIVGVVVHQRDTTLAREGREEVFVPDGYVGFGGVNRWAVRTSRDPLRLVSAIRAKAAEIDPRLLITEVQPMEAFVNQSQAQTRFALTTIGIFAIVAAILAVIGVYGVLAATVQQRTAEIGVRMAVGARPASIFQLIVGQGLKLCAAGIFAGALAALALTRIMVSLLVSVKPDDPPTFVAIAILFLFVAMLACWVPAWRAARLDPTVALRR